MVHGSDAAKMFQVRRISIFGRSRRPRAPVSASALVALWELLCIDPSAEQKHEGDLDEYDEEYDDRDGEEYGSDTPDDEEEEADNHGFLGLSLYKKLTEFAADTINALDLWESVL